MEFKSLSTRLIIYFLLMVLVPISVGGYISFYHSRQALEDQVEKQLTSVITLKEEELASWAEHVKFETLVLSENPHVAENALVLLNQAEEEFGEEYTAQEAYQMLEKQLAGPIKVGGFIGFFIMRENDGKVVFSTDLEDLGKFKSTKTYFKEGKKALYVQSLYYSLTLRDTAMTIATPLRNEAGEVRGVFAARVNLEKLDRIMGERSGMGRTGETYLVNKYNHFISEPKYVSKYPFKMGIYTEGVNAALSGKNGISIYDNYRGAKVIGAYRWIDALNVALLAEIEQNEAFEPARDLREEMILLGLLFSAIAIPLASVFTRNIVKPIHRVMEGVEAIRRGDLEYRLNMRRADEIGALANAFDRMASDLKKFRSELRQHNLKLEAEVEERTKELKKAYEEIKTLDEVKSNIIANVSHELRTPITVAKGALELLADEDDPALREKLINMAKGVLERQNRIVGDLIEAARMRKIKKWTPSLEEVDLNEIVTIIVEEFTPLVAKKGIMLETKLDRRLPRVKADFERLAHAVRNLVDNAVKFTSKGGTITIETFHKNGTVKFSVSDTGIGIPIDKQKKIFEYFYQVDNSRTRRYEGAGMGLAIAKEIIEAHGGEIGVESVPGMGSRFFFALPCESCHGERKKEVPLRTLQ